MTAAHETRSPRTGVVYRHFAGPERHVGALSTPLRVAHVSDQHIGMVTPMRLQRAIMEEVNGLGVDLVALTGDYVGYGLGYLDRLEEVLARLEVPAIAVLGNHDHFAGAAEVRRTLERVGVTVLSNAWTEFRCRGEQIQVVGLDDAYTGHADAARATAGLDRRRPVLALSHIAEEADQLWSLGAPLVLSGHTHAGHITVGGLHEFTLGRIFGYRYLHGLYGSRAADALGAVYVSAGIGASVFGLRVGERARREVPVFTLGTPRDPANEHHAEQSPQRAWRPFSERKIETRQAKIARQRARHASRATRA